jgi:hypothetical protein
MRRSVVRRQPVPSIDCALGHHAPRSFHRDIFGEPICRMRSWQAAGGEVVSLTKSDVRIRDPFVPHRHAGSITARA